MKGLFYLAAVAVAMLVLVSVASAGPIADRLCPQGVCPIQVSAIVAPAQVPQQAVSVDVSTGTGTEILVTNRPLLSRITGIYAVGDSAASGPYCTTTTVQTRRVFAPKSVQPIQFQRLRAVRSVQPVQAVKACSPVAVMPAPRACTPVTAMPKACGPVAVAQAPMACTPVTAMPQACAPVAACGPVDGQAGTATVGSVLFARVRVRLNNLCVRLANLIPRRA